MTDARGHRPRKITRPVRDGRVWSWPELTQMQRAHHRDPLTGCMSRRFLDDVFRQTVMTGDKLVLVNIQGLRTASTRNQRASASALLLRVADVLRSAVDGIGVAVRLAGEDFCLILHKPTPAVVRDLQTKVKTAINAMGTHAGAARTSEGAPRFVVRFGEVGLRRGKNVQHALIEAAHALRDARAPQHASMSLAPQGTQGSAADYDTAIRNKEIVFYLQPIVATRTGETAGYEALIRQELPDGRVLGPEEIIATLGQSFQRQSGLPIPAARDAALWVMQNTSAFICFNITLPFLLRTALNGLDWLDEMLEGLAPERMVFELIETIETPSPHYLVLFTVMLRRRGFRVALDDFGAGQSTLQRLQDVPVDIVKIDRDYITTARTNMHDRDLLASMIALAHACGAQVVLEGIETAEDLALAQALGADYVQGYFLGRPQPVSALARPPGQ